MATGALALDLVDVRGNGIRDDVRIELAAVDRSERYRNTVFVEKTVQVGGIECDPFARYQVTVWPSDYRISQFFIMLQAGRVTTREPLYMPVDADKVTGIRAPAYDALDLRLRTMLQESDVDTSPGQQGAALYTSLDPARKACLLNIFTKAANTRLLDGSSCFDQLGGLVRLRGDRFFAKTRAALREEVQNAQAVFREVSELLHHPPDGFTPAGSFKSRGDRYGNLQLSFFRRGSTGDDYLVDADIDEATGIEHGFEVARNFLKDHTTSPFDVREILIRHQSLDPGYDFEFAEEAEVRKAQSTGTRS